MSVSLANCLEALESISVEELDESINYLEEAIHTFKTLRAVLVVLNKKMPEPVEEWVSAVDQDKEENRNRIIGRGGSPLLGGELLEIIKHQLESHPEGRTVRQLVECSGVSDSAVTYHLRRNPSLFFLVGKKDTKTPAVWAHLKHRDRATYAYEHINDQGAA